MIGKIFITSSGYDPQFGKHVKDPYLGPNPSIGACRPDVRRVVTPGDYIFTISGKIPRLPQFIMGGFQVAEKIHASAAYEIFPERRLRQRADGQLDGNIIVDADGDRHPLDNHKGFDRRLENYVIGQNPVALVRPDEIARGREETMDILRRVFNKIAYSPFKVVGRAARTLSDDQVMALLDWLSSVKRHVKVFPMPTAHHGSARTGH